MSEKIYFLHLKTGNKRITWEEAIVNAEDQKTQGVTPHYTLFDNSKKEKLSTPGWLIWSTWQDGAGVVLYVLVWLIPESLKLYIVHIEIYIQFPMVLYLSAEALCKVYSIFARMDKSFWNFRNSILAIKVCIRD